MIKAACGSSFMIKIYIHSNNCTMHKQYNRWPPHTDLPSLTKPIHEPPLQNSRTKISYVGFCSRSNKARYLVIWELPGTEIPGLFPGNFSLRLGPRHPCPEVVCSCIWEIFREHQGYTYLQGKLYVRHREKNLAAPKELMIKPLALVLTLTLLFIIWPCHCLRVVGRLSIRQVQDAVHYPFPNYTYFIPFTCTFAYWTNPF